MHKFISAWICWFYQRKRVQDRPKESNCGSIVVRCDIIKRLSSDYLTTGIWPSSKLDLKSLFTLSFFSFFFSCLLGRIFLLLFSQLHPLDVNFLSLFTSFFYFALSCDLHRGSRVDKKIRAPELLKTIHFWGNSCHFNDRLKSLLNLLYKQESKKVHTLESFNS